MAGTAHINHPHLKSFHGHGAHHDPQPGSLLHVELYTPHVQVVDGGVYHRLRSDFNHLGIRSGCGMWDVEKSQWIENGGVGVVIR